MCTDNGAMIAHAAVMRLQRGLPVDDLEVRSRLPLGPRMPREPAGGVRAAL